ncbi:hypothetical protein BDK51DRAFT_28322 [Blyttiomyces helicus]|uniref:Uncharacterized protein n=1 Tax=Blyttiomyces helicus TaxID=388810 RepID=A0A4P9W976_9FUNG|nr:hypothetical protein BDK51DRAFT_28322 [Blyttiomyces helicus]|eukprot:RKO87658.1 hypothetical protein BDK51DRAFT_28322 [Blyttiomyces helicus]
MGEMKPRRDGEAVRLCVSWIDRIESSSQPSTRVAFKCVSIEWVACSNERRTVENRFLTGGRGGPGPTGLKRNMLQICNMDQEPDGTQESLSSRAPNGTCRHDWEGEAHPRAHVSAPRRGLTTGLGKGVKRLGSTGFPRNAPFVNQYQASLSHLRPKRLPILTPKGIACFANEIDATAIELMKFECDRIFFAKNFFLNRRMVKCFDELGPSTFSACQVWNCSQTECRYSQLVIVVQISPESFEKKRHELWCPIFDSVTQIFIDRFLEFLSQISLTSSPPPSIMGIALQVDQA